LQPVAQDLVGGDATGDNQNRLVGVRVKVLEYGHGVADAICENVARRNLERGAKISYILFLKVAGRQAFDGLADFRFEPGE
jgi:hypothetical protein